MQTTTTSTGLCLLPNDLLHDIFLRLPLPSLLRLRSVSTSLGSLTSSPHFRRLFLSSSSPDSASWLFLSAKRFPRSSLLLRGFHLRSARWFIFSLPSTLPDDIYLLAASASFLLFSSPLQLIVVNIFDNTSRTLPPSPLGPRGISSWCRSSFKLLSDVSGTTFRFLFADLLSGRPTIFKYSSVTDMWQSMSSEPLNPICNGHGGRIFLNVSDFMLVVSNSNNDQPMVGYCLPRFFEGVDGLHVYGDGYVAVVRSRSLTVGDGARRVLGVELWGLGRDRRGWEMVTRCEDGLVEEMKGRRYGVMSGCLEERAGVVWLVLVSNLKGEWAIDWLGFDKGRKEWECVKVGDCGNKGFNMAGFSLSSFFFGRWPSSKENILDE